MDKFKLILLSLLLLISQIIYALQSESEHFVIFYEIKDSSVINAITDTLENNLDRISTDLNYVPNNKIEVFIYPSLQDFHNAISWPDAPDWVIGQGYSDIKMVSPLNPGPIHNYTTVMQGLVHEYVHVITHLIVGIANPHPGDFQPNWLFEGLAVWEAHQTVTQSQLQALINKQEIPSLDKLNNIYTFANIGGYELSYTIVEYIVKRLGYTILQRFIKDSNNFSILGFNNQTDFENAWHEFLKEEYNLIIPTGISNLKISDIVTIIYNNGILLLSLQEPHDVVIEMHSLTGAKISTLMNGYKTMGDYLLTVDKNNLSAGIYLISVQLDNKKIELKKVYLKKD